jgi:hypothetical protein
MAGMYGIDPWAGFFPIAVQPVRVIRVGAALAAIGPVYVNELSPMAPVQKFSGIWSRLIITSRVFSLPLI